MRIIDCVWEKDNLGKNTVEIELDSKDYMDESLFRDIDERFDYHVFKVSSDNIVANELLCRKGYHLVETQIGIEMKRQDFKFILNDPLVKYLYKDLSFEDIERPEQFKEITDNIAEDMFKTDRIALDPVFGLECSHRRYVNWMTSAFNNKSASFYKMIYSGENVGFSMFRIDQDIFYGILGGVYSNVTQGLGLLTACAGAKYIEEKGLKIKKTRTSISSNNLPIIQVYNHCHFNFNRFTHVFVKHLDTI